MWESNPDELSRTANYLTVAEGYLELGMFLDADAELERMDPRVRDLPEVLALRVRIYSALRKWDMLRVVSRRLVAADPAEPRWLVAFAKAVRMLHGPNAAHGFLAAAASAMQSGELYYHLACVECRLGNVAAAAVALQRAFALDPALRQAALVEPELEAICDTA